MQSQSKQVPVRVEGIVALLILDRSRSHSELESELHDTSPGVVSDALERLTAEGVVVVESEQVCASKCARHLDALGLIAV